MCLPYDKAATNGFWNTRGRKGKSWCWAYKLFLFVDGELRPAFGCLFGKKNHIVKAGYVKSDRSSKIPFKDDSDQTDCAYINKGIHVIINSQKVAEYLSVPWNDVPIVTARVKCLKKDFVASSKLVTKTMHDGAGEAVFMKVFLPKSERDRILKKFSKTKKL